MVWTPWMRLTNTYIRTTARNGLCENDAKHRGGSCKAPHQFLDRVGNGSSSRRPPEPFQETYETSSRLEGEAFCIIRELSAFEVVLY